MQDFRRSDWPLPLLLEQTAEGFFVADPCWLFTWQLDELQYAALVHLLKSSALSSVLHGALPSEYYQNVFKAINHSLAIDCPDQDSINRANALFFSIASAIAPSLELQEIPFKSGRVVKKGALAYRGCNHFLTGKLLQWLRDLLRLIIKIKSGSKLKKFEMSKLRSQFANYVRLDSIVSSDWILLQILQIAQNQKIHIMPVDIVSGIWQVGVCGDSRLFRHSSNDRDSHLGALVAQNKSSASILLKKLGCRVPAEISLGVGQLSEFLHGDVAQTVSYPCVVKPVNGDGGKGVTAYIQNVVVLENALYKARKYTNKALLIQEQILGDDYRLYCIDGCLTHAVRKQPPSLIGNGKDSVEKLLALENVLRSKMIDNGLYCSLLQRGDPEFDEHLANAGYGWSDVPEPNVLIRLRSNSNVKTGGIRTVIPIHSVHPRLKRQCENVAKTFRLNVCGIDYITTDITKDPFLSSGAFIEVNAVPDSPKDRAEALLRNLSRNGHDSVDVSVLVADWFSSIFVPDKKIIQRLSCLSKNVVIAVPSARLIQFCKMLPSEITPYLHGYDHVYDPALNSSACQLIYLLTPDWVLQHGLPLPNVKSVELFGMDSSKQAHRQVVSFANELYA